MKLRIDRIQNSHHSQTHRIRICRGLADCFVIRGHQHDGADARADHIHQNLGFAAIAAIAFEPLRDQKTKPGEGLVLDG